MNLPETFQTPNEYVDYFCSRLTGAEFKLLMVAVRKICGFSDHRKSMRDRISYSQFVKMSGVTDRVTIGKSLDRLCKLGLLKKVGRLTQYGQEWKLVRYLRKVGQQELALELLPQSGFPTKVVGKPDQGGRETRHTKPIIKPIYKDVNVRTDGTPINVEFKEPESNDEIVAYLRKRVISGNGEADPASKTLMFLEQLWNWGAVAELQKSWVWFYSCAKKYPGVFDRAMGETKVRMLSTTLKPLRKPGAYMTTLIKSYAGIT